MPTTYRDAPEVETIAAHVIADVHPHLRESRIRYLFRDAETPWMSRGKERWATAQPLSGATRHLADSTDAVVTVARRIWITLGADHRVALLDHELSHLEPATSSEGEVLTHDDTGTPILRAVAHDLEEFEGVVHRRGLWRSEVETMAATMAAATKARARPMPLRAVGDEEAEAQ